MNIRYVISTLFLCIHVIIACQNKPITRNFCVVNENAQVFLAGGGGLSQNIYQKFYQLCAKDSSKVAIIPSASVNSLEYSKWSDYIHLKQLFGKRIKIIHTWDRKQANSDEFVNQIDQVGALWFGGGRVWRLHDAFQNTIFIDSLIMRSARLSNSFVFGGTSAGAAIYGKKLIRGDREESTTDFDLKHDGFGLVNNAIIETHYTQRSREQALEEIIRKNTELIGIGIDENTAVVISNNRFEVIGNGIVEFIIGSGRKSISKTTFVEGIYDINDIYK